jgi:hypothetical protein
LDPPTGVPGHLFRKALPKWDSDSNPGRLCRTLEIVLRLAFGDTYSFRGTTISIYDALGDMCNIGGLLPNVKSLRVAMPLRPDDGPNPWQALAHFLSGISELESLVIEPTIRRAWYPYLQEQGGRQKPIPLIKAGNFAYLVPHLSSLETLTVRGLDGSGYEGADDVDLMPWLLSVSPPIPCESNFH